MTKHLILLKIQNLIAINEELLLWFIFFFGKQSSSGAAKSEITPNQQLAEELHRPIIKKFEKCKKYFFFKNNIWGADLADIQLISKFNKGVFFLLCVIDIYSKYAWFFPLKYRKGVTITKAFQKVSGEPGSK